MSGRPNRSHNQATTSRHRWVRSQCRLCSCSPKAQPLFKIYFPIQESLNRGIPKSLLQCSLVSRRRFPQASPRHLLRLPFSPLPGRCSQSFAGCW